MFEKAFLPYVHDHWQQRGSSIVDPIDECMMHCFSKAADIFRSGK
jgi:hypothetical protein